MLDWLALRKLGHTQLMNYTFTENETSAYYKYSIYSIYNLRLYTKLKMDFLLFCALSRSRKVFYSYYNNSEYLDQLGWLESLLLQLKLFKSPLYSFPEPPNIPYLSIVFGSIGSCCGMSSTSDPHDIDSSYVQDG